jgi:hypothetical protein
MGAAEPSEAATKPMKVTKSTKSTKRTVMFCPRGMKQMNFHELHVVRDKNKD